VPCAPFKSGYYILPKKYQSTRNTSCCNRRIRFLDGKLLEGMQKKIKGKDVGCVILRNELFRDDLFYCASQFAVVDVEGPSEHFFAVVRRKRKQNPSNQSAATGTQVSTPNNAARSREGTETTPDSAAALPSDLRSIHARGIESGDAEDIARVRALGFDVDDDNEPAPENVPTQEETTQAGLKDNMLKICRGDDLAAYKFWCSRSWIHR